MIEEIGRRKKKDFHLSDISRAFENSRLHDFFSHVEFPCHHRECPPTHEKLTNAHDLEIIFFLLSCSTAKKQFAIVHRQLYFNMWRMGIEKERRNYAISDINQSWRTRWAVVCQIATRLRSPPSVTREVCCVVNFCCTLTQPQPQVESLLLLHKLLIEVDYLISCRCRTWWQCICCKF